MASFPSTTLYGNCKLIYQQASCRRTRLSCRTPNTTPMTARVAARDATSERRVAAADTWLSTNIAPWWRARYFGRAASLVLTTDESRTDGTHGGGHVATILLGTGIKAGYQGAVLYDHRSLLGLSMTALGVTTIPNGAGSAPQVTEFFQ